MMPFACDIGDSSAYASNVACALGAMKHVSEAVKDTIRSWQLTLISLPGSNMLSTLIIQLLFYIVRTAYPRCETAPPSSQRSIASP